MTIKSWSTISKVCDSSKLSSVPTKSTMSCKKDSFGEIQKLFTEHQSDLLAFEPKLVPLYVKNSNQRQILQI